MSASCVAIESPPMAAETVAAAGVFKAHLSWGRMIVLSVLAGVYIGVGAQLAMLATSTGDGSKPSGPQTIFGGAVFSVGLIMIVIAGAELFTGSSRCSTAASVSGRCWWTGPLCTPGTSSDPSFSPRWSTAWASTVTRPPPPPPRRRRLRR